MDTFQDLIDAVSGDLKIPNTGNSTYTLPMIKRALNRAYARAGALYRWPETEDAQKRNSVANREYYDYPRNWRPDSMFRLEVDGNIYGNEPDGSPMDFNDFLTWKKNNSNSTDKKWSTQWRRFFVYPVITTNGDKNIKTWGQKAVDELEFETDTTIFSYHMRECNDAVVLEAGTILRGDEDDKDRSDLMVNEDAFNILTRSWAKIASEQSKYEKEQPMFDVDDMFSDGYGSDQVIGNFVDG